MEEPIWKAGCVPHGVTISSVDFNKICKDYGIRAFAYSSALDLMSKCGLDPAKSPGYAFITDGVPVILFDDRRTDLEIRFTVAHELGHILLGHLDYRAKAGQMPAFAEREADGFAAALIVIDILCRYGKAVTV